MFRFTIRDVLWLTVVVACLVVWWIDRTKLLSGFADLRSKNGRLTSRLAELRSENSRLTKDQTGPGWIASWTSTHYIGCGSRSERRSLVWNRHQTHSTLRLNLETRSRKCRLPFFLRSQQLLIRRDSR